MPQPAAAGLCGGPGDPHRNPSPSQVLEGFPKETALWNYSSLADETQAQSG